jgi:hypothetical protein
MTTLTFNGVKVTLIFSDPNPKMCDACVQCEKVEREVFQLKRTLEQILSMITRGVEFNLDAPATSTCEERQASIPVINEP